MKRLILAALAAAVAAGSASAAQAKIPDPRKCPSTPAYCASHAAGVVAIAKVKRTSSPKPVGFVQAHCNPRGSLLRWLCRLNDSGGHGWNVRVVYRATSAGWRVTATVIASGIG